MSDYIRDHQKLEQFKAWWYIHIIQHVSHLYLCVCKSKTDSRYTKCTIIKAIVKHFTYFLSCQTLDEKIDAIDVGMLNMKLQPAWLPDC